MNYLIMPIWKNFENNKACKIDRASFLDTPSHTLPLGHFALSPVIPPLEEDTYFVDVHFPINLGIDNIPTNSPEVCTRSLTLSPENAKTP